MKTVIMLLAIIGMAGSAYAQGCPGGFWGNGQCIAPCESPLVNPNVSLSFYGYQCSAQPPCENNYVYCYPSYTGWDNAYNQYCGVIIDWNDGGCTPEPPLALAFPHSAFKLAILIRRPVEFKPRPIKRVTLKSRFWWKHTQIHA